MKLVWHIKEVQLVNTKDAVSRIKSILSVGLNRTLEELLTGSELHVHLIRDLKQTR